MSEEGKMSRPEVYEVQQPPLSYIPSEQQYPSGQYSPGYQGTFEQQQYSNVVVINQPNPTGGVVYVRAQNSDYNMNLAIFSCFCCFIPTGLCAIVAASNAKSSAKAGDLEAAEKSARIAKILSIIGMVIGVTWITILIIIRVLYYPSFY